MSLEFVKTIPALNDRGELIERPCPADWRGVAVRTQDEMYALTSALCNAVVPVRFWVLEPKEEINADPPLCQYGCHGDYIDSENDPPWCTYCDSEAVYGHWLDACADEFQAGINWVIVKGDTEPMHPDWVRGIRDQCNAASVPFFFAGWGDWLPFYDRDVDDPDWRSIPKETKSVRRMNLAGGQGFHGERVVYFQRAGARFNWLLDGREWLQFPEAVQP